MNDIFVNYDKYDSTAAYEKIYESDPVESFCHGGKVLSEKEKYRRHRKANRKEIEKEALRRARVFKDGTTAQRAVEKKAGIRRRRYAA